MPLYVVRWPLGKVSIIRAHHEDELVGLIDESGSPSDCTWTMYNGPFRVDFELAGVRRSEKYSGPIEKDEVILDNPDVALEHLMLTAPGDSEAFGEMQDRIREKAFPKLAKALNKLRDENPDAEPRTLDTDQRKLLAEAVAADEVLHDYRRHERGLGYSTRGFRAIRMLYYQKRGDSFRSLRMGDFERFCYGRKRLKPEIDGFMRAVGLRVSFEPGDGHLATIDWSIKLRADPSGTIVTPHRADVFDDVVGEGLSNFKDRRNDAVRWILDDRDRAVLMNVSHEAIFERRTDGRLD